MRIAQITPGNIPIPPNGWGAVEKLIWEYTKVLRKLGHHVEILYADDVNPGEWDVVHVHMANLALILRDRGIPYVFSHHDHHAFHFGNNSDVYKQNMEAIRGSKLTFVHAKYLIDYFGGLSNIRYLGHGANPEDYGYLDGSDDIRSGHINLVMMANNGLGGNHMYDRKGFIPGIEAARKMGLPITIMCPSKGNRELMESIKPYDKLEVLYDLDYTETIERMRDHHIFLSPSMLEAGHPNLTITESIAMGMPVVGTMESDMPGLSRIDMNSDLTIDVDHLVTSIKDVISRYSSYVLECKTQRSLLSWEVVVSRMLMDYTRYLKIGQRNLLMSSYQSAIKMEDNITMSNGFYSWFKNGPFLYKSLQTRQGTSVSFIDNRTGEILSRSNMSDSARSWSLFPDVPGRYVDWKIVVKEGCRIIYQSNMDLFGQHVLVRNAELSDIDMISNFQQSTGCVITTDNETQLSSGFFILGNGNIDDFYRILSMDQIRDFYTDKEKIDKKILVEFITNALGDNIAFIPYVNEFAKSIGEKVYVSCLHSALFDSNYTNIEFIEKDSVSHRYTDYISVGYLFDMPLQKGMAYQLGLDYKEIRPVIKEPTGSHKLIKGKYVCFSMHSTTQAKHWNNNNAWSKLCDELVKIGITPVCIDRYRSFGIEGNWNHIPLNCIDRTGGDLNDMSLLIRDSEFFIGLSSGLSWLAHGLGKKVVLISGVTSPDNEFTLDCLRIHRDDVCNSCFSKTNDYVFNSGDWLWCPEHKGTSRQFECTKKISAKQVMDALKSKRWI
jgi:autotransporter strand-loop-strand O-heptosyltransferase